MLQSNLSIPVRSANLEDAEALCALLNEVIIIGGTTAIETSLKTEEFRDYFLQGEMYISCFVALDEEGAIAGFQALNRHTELDEDWADIATFARVSPRVYGIGKPLFSVTCEYAKNSGLKAINATIREDNQSGLKYYSQLGFETYKVTSAVPLNDGTLVDRLSKSFFLK